MPDLELALQSGNRRERRVSPERRKEKARRMTMASNLARQAVINLHHDDYDDLYRQAMDKVHAERGPLPE